MRQKLSTICAAIMITVLTIVGTVVDAPYIKNIVEAVAPQNNNGQLANGNPFGLPSISLGTSPFGNLGQNMSLQLNTNFLPLIIGGPETGPERPCILHPPDFHPQWWIDLVYADLIAAGYSVADATDISQEMPVLINSTWYEDVESQNSFANGSDNGYIIAATIDSIINAAGNPVDVFVTPTPALSYNSFNNFCFDSAQDPYPPTLNDAENGTGINTLFLYEGNENDDSGTDEFDDTSRVVDERKFLVAQVCEDPDPSTETNEAYDAADHTCDGQFLSLTNYSALQDTANVEPGDVIRFGVYIHNNSLYPDNTSAIADDVVINFDTDTNPNQPKATVTSTDNRYHADPYDTSSPLILDTEDIDADGNTTEQVSFMSDATNVLSSGAIQLEPIEDGVWYYNSEIVNLHSAYPQSIVPGWQHEVNIPGNTVTLEFYPDIDTSTDDHEMEINQIPGCFEFDGWYFFDYEVVSDEEEPLCYNIDLLWSQPNPPDPIIPFGDVPTDVPAVENLNSTLGTNIVGPDEGLYIVNESESPMVFEVDRQGYTGPLTWEIFLQTGVYYTPGTPHFCTNDTFLPQFDFCFTPWVLDTAGNYSLITTNLGDDEILKIFNLGEGAIVRVSAPSQYVAPKGMCTDAAFIPQCIDLTIDSPNLTDDGSGNLTTTDALPFTIDVTTDPYYWNDILTYSTTNTACGLFDVDGDGTWENSSDGTQNGLPTTNEVVTTSTNVVYDISLDPSCAGNDGVGDTIGVVNTNAEGNKGRCQEEFTIVDVICECDPNTMNLIQPGVTTFTQAEAIAGQTIEVEAQANCSDGSVINLTDFEYVSTSASANFTDDVAPITYGNTGGSPFQSDGTITFEDPTPAAGQQVTISAIEQSGLVSTSCTEVIDIEPIECSELFLNAPYTSGIVPYAECANVSTTPINVTTTVLPTTWTGQIEWTSDDPTMLLSDDGCATTSAGSITTTADGLGNGLEIDICSCTGGETIDIQAIGETDPDCNAELEIEVEEVPGECTELELNVLSTDVYLDDGVPAIDAEIEVTGGVGWPGGNVTMLVCQDPSTLGSCMANFDTAATITVNSTNPSGLTIVANGSNQPSVVGMLDGYTAEVTIDNISEESFSFAAFVIGEPDECNDNFDFGYCGDGDDSGPDEIPGTPDDEECDDGNNTPGDGCNEFCEEEEIECAELTLSTINTATPGIVTAQECEDADTVPIGLIANPIPTNWSGTLEWSSPDPSISFAPDDPANCSTATPGPLLTFPDGSGAGLVVYACDCIGGVPLEVEAIGEDPECSGLIDPDEEFECTNLLVNATPDTYLQETDGSVDVEVEVNADTGWTGGDLVMLVCTDTTTLADCQSTLDATAEIVIQNITPTGPTATGDGTNEVTIGTVENGHIVEATIDNIDNPDNLFAAFIVDSPQCFGEFGFGYCGDGVPDPSFGEDCDDGNTNNDDSCNNSCNSPGSPGDPGGDPLCSDLTIVTPSSGSSVTGFPVFIAFETSPVNWPNLSSGFIWWTSNPNGYFQKSDFTTGPGTASSPFLSDETSIQYYGEYGDTVYVADSVHSFGGCNDTITITQEIPEEPEDPDDPGDPGGPGSGGDGDPDGDPDGGLACDQLEIHSINGDTGFTELEDEYGFIEILSPPSAITLNDPNPYSYDGPFIYSALVNGALGDVYFIDPTATGAMPAIDAAINSGDFTALANNPLADTTVETESKYIFYFNVDMLDDVIITVADSAYPNNLSCGDAVQNYEGFLGPQLDKFGWIHPYGANTTTESAVDVNYQITYYNSNTEITEVVITDTIGDGPTFYRAIQPATVPGFESNLGPQDYVVFSHTNDIVDDINLDSNPAIEPGIDTFYYGLGVHWIQDVTNDPDIGTWAGHDDNDVPQVPRCTDYKFTQSELDELEAAGMDPESFEGLTIEDSPYNSASAGSQIDPFIYNEDGAQVIFLETYENELCFEGRIDNTAGITVKNMDPDTVIKLEYEGIIYNDDFVDNCNDGGALNLTENFYNEAFAEPQNGNYVGPVITDDETLYSTCKYALTRNSGDVYFYDDYNGEIDPGANLAALSVEETRNSDGLVLINNVLSGVVDLWDQGLFGPFPATFGNSTPSICDSASNEYIPHMFSSFICQAYIDELTVPEWQPISIVDETSLDYLEGYTHSTNSFYVSELGNVALENVIADNSLAFSQDTRERIFKFDGDLTIGDAGLSTQIEVPAGARTIIVDGNLTINQDIVYPSALDEAGKPDHEIASIAFIVNGNIDVHANVGEMAGVYMIRSEELYNPNSEFSTEEAMYIPGSTRSFDGVGGSTVMKQLIINGSVYGNLQPLINDRDFVGPPITDGGNIVIRYSNRILRNTPPALKDELGTEWIHVSR